MTNKPSLINYLLAIIIIKTIFKVDCSKFLKQTKRVEKLKKWV